VQLYSTHGRRRTTAAFARCLRQENIGIRRRSLRLVGGAMVAKRGVEFRSSGQVKWSADGPSHARAQLGDSRKAKAGRSFPSDPGPSHRSGKRRAIYYADGVFAGDRRNRDHRLQTTKVVSEGASRTGQACSASAYKGRHRAQRRSSGLTVAIWERLHRRRGATGGYFEKAAASNPRSNPNSVPHGGL